MKDEKPPLTKEQIVEAEATWKAVHATIRYLEAVRERIGKMEMKAQYGESVRDLCFRDGWNSALCRVDEIMAISPFDFMMNLREEEE